MLGESGRVDVGNLLLGLLDQKCLLMNEKHLLLLRSQRRTLLTRPHVDGSGPRVLRGGQEAPAPLGLALEGGWLPDCWLPRPTRFPTTVRGALGRTLGDGTLVAGTSTATLLFGGRSVGRRLAARRKQGGGGRRGTLIHGELLNQGGARL
jgi:hypothetical protein